MVLPGSANLIGGQGVSVKLYPGRSLEDMKFPGAPPVLKLACGDMLVKIGRPAVPPLCEAVINLTGVSQRTVCDILGTIKHPNAAPYLRELATNDAVDGPVREAAQRAFTALSARNVDIELVVQTRGRAHMGEVLAALRADGFEAGEPV